MSAWVTGGAGETGRTFYYRERTTGAEEVSPDALRDALASVLLAQVPGASDEACAAIGQSVERWIADATGTGVGGWRTLDVVYAEQRVRRWLRGMLTDATGVAIPAFSAPEVQRALVSLPLAERAADGFHRRFLAKHAEDLLPRAPRQAGRLARLLGRFRPVGEQASPGLRIPWGEHPEFQAWIADEILGSSALADALGESWCAETRRGFLAQAPQALDNALWAAGPIALAAELDALKEP